MMRSSSVLVVLAALGGGTVGSLLTAFFLTPAAATSPEKERPPSAAERPATDGSDALDELRSRLNSVDRRVSLLTFSKGPALPKPNPGGDSGADAADATAARTVDDPVFEAAVRDVLDQVEYERDAERDARRAEWRAERTKRWTTGLAERLGLNPSQAESLAKLMEEHMSALRALRDSDDAPVLRTEWRARMKTLSDQSEQKLSALLDASQKAKYDTLDEGDKLGGQGFWGRGGGRE